MEAPDDIRETVHHTAAADVVPAKAALEPLLVPALPAVEVAVHAFKLPQLQVKALVGVHDGPGLLHVCEGRLAGQALFPHEVAYADGAAAGHALRTVHQHGTCRMGIWGRQRSSRQHGRRVL